MSTAVATPAATPFPKLDAVVDRVKASAAAFARLAIDERIRMVEDFRVGYRAISEASVEAACRAKGIDPRSPVSGEEWLGGPLVTLRTLRLTSEALREVKRFGAPRIEREWMRTLPDGRLAIKVFPANGLDAVLLAKHVAEVYMQPGVTAANLREHQALFYRQPHQGKLCLVLGGGNVNAIPATDVVYKMFVEGKVCVLKMNPVNAYLGPFIERAFRSAVDRGFLAVVYGGAAEGGHLLNHPAIDEVHITGSDKTYELMVWGPPGAEREARKQKNQPLLTKEISSELGNISPVIVVPGPYTDDELAFQGDNIAGMVANNASFNCNAAKLLVTSKHWGRRDQLMRSVSTGIAKAPLRSAYYPGAEQRWKEFTEGRAGLQLIGKPGKDQLAYAIIPDVDPLAIHDRVFTQEPWCTVLSETALPAADPAAFVMEAVRFVNEKVWGTLTATLVVHPKTLSDPVHGPAVEQALRELRYGAVCVNTWAGAVFGLGVTPWGGHPSSTPQNIQSGQGWVHNTFMLEEIEKSVLRAPLKVFPINPWFPGHRSVDLLARRLVDFEMSPSWLKMPGIAAAAMRG